MNREHKKVTFNNDQFRRSERLCAECDQMVHGEEEYVYVYFQITMSKRKKFYSGIDLIRKVNSTDTEYSEDSEDPPPKVTPSKLYNTDFINNTRLTLII